MDNTQVGNTAVKVPSRRGTFTDPGLTGQVGDCATVLIDDAVMDDVSDATSTSIQTPLSLSNVTEVLPFVLCIGDDKSDEEMFLALQNNPRLKPEEEKDEKSKKDRKDSKDHKSPNVTSTSIPPTSTTTQSSSLKKDSTKERKARFTHKDSDSKKKAKRPAIVNSLKRGSVNGLFMGQGSRSGVPTTDSDDESEESQGEEDAGNRESSLVVNTSNLFTCTVGIKPSAAHYYLHDSDEVIEIIKTLSYAAGEVAEKFDELESVPEEGM